MDVKLSSPEEAAGDHLPQPQEEAAAPLLVPHPVEAAGPPPSAETKRKLQKQKTDVLIAKGKGRAEELVDSVLPTRMFIGHLLHNIAHDGKIDEKDSPQLKLLLERQLALWNNSVLMSSLMVSLLIAYCFTMETNPTLQDEDEILAGRLEAAFAIVATLATATMMCSLTIAYIFSVYASCLHYLRDIAWFFTEVQVGLPNILNIVALVCFYILCSIGVVLSHGLTWYGLLCSCIWLVVMVVVAWYYATLKSKLRGRWQSAEWRERHHPGKEDDISVAC